MNYKTSVIVPIYKVESYLRSCLDSILAQTYRNFELLLIDDGSPDSCGAICDEYARQDNRIRVIHQMNQGIASVRNMAIREAQGEYLLFIDGDDTIHPDLLQEATACADESKADIVIFHYQAIDAAGRFLYSAQINLPEKIAFSMEENPEVLLTPASLCNKYIKKDVFLDIHFPADTWYEDLWMTPRLYVNARHIVYLGKKHLYNYLIRPGSIMRSGNLDKLYQDRTKALSELLDYFQNLGLLDRYKEELEAMTALHGFFYASLEILNTEKNRLKLAEFRSFIQSKFKDFPHNRYLRQLGAKERLQFWLLYHKLYSMIRLLSYLRKMTR